ncbi:MAG: DUF971 domain-containing protein [Gammaproteobacteria bacterium]|nr:DUF971 domain-containing protein [Gammaproteobacteria bacterium]
MGSKLQEPVSLEPGITSTTSADNGLNITWSDGHASFFHFIWLRDCCYCEQCGNTYTSKRYLVPSDIPLDIKPGSVQVDVDGNLQIQWSPDDHTSHYDAAWLRQNCYDDASRATRFQQPILWDAKISERPPRVSFDKARNDDECSMDLYRKLRDFGFVVITGGPNEPGSVEAVANLIGDMGESAYSRIFDLTPMSKTRTLGNTTRPVPPHTDEAFRHNPPGINILGCVKPAEDGGDSVLVDGFKLASILRHENPRSFSMLTDYAQSYHRVHDSGRGKAVDERTRQRMFVLDDRGEVVGCAYIRERPDRWPCRHGNWRLTMPPIIASAR